MGFRVANGIQLAEISMQRVLLALSLGLLRFRTTWAVPGTDDCAGPLHVCLDWRQVYYSVA